MSHSPDDAQYSRTAIEAYEAVYGADFVSPGGAATARPLLDHLELAPGMRALDVGSGLGGCAFLLHREFGVAVDGIDVSPEMVAMAEDRRRRHGLPDAVRFEHADVMGWEGPAAYDVVHAREVFLHIADKPGLLAALAARLRPGGQLLFTDYLRGDPPYSDEFQAYMTRYGYSLHTFDEYQALLDASPFEPVLAEDRTDEFVRIHERELRAMAEAAIPEPHASELAAGWRAKLARAKRGEQRWGLFVARLGA